MPCVFILVFGCVITLYCYCSNHYYLTDLPTIISGERIAYLEPHMEIWSGHSGRYYCLADYVRNAEDTFAPFENLCGFSVHKTTENFMGTLFRFPLRNEEKENHVSSHIYDINKLRALVAALTEEAKFILLFLRSVTTIKVFEITKDNCHSKLLEVTVREVETGWLGSKEGFFKQIKDSFDCHSYCISDPIELCLRVQVDVNDHQGDINTSQWVIVSRVGSQSKVVHDTAQTLKAFPWVGVALEINQIESTVGGRVFCVLPLPKDVSSNLPVHVNATFSLNDDRRALKWPGPEVKNDHSAKWNSLIIAHLLPECYASLLLHIKDIVEPSTFFKAWPDANSVKDTHWECFLTPLYNLLFNHDVFLQSHEPQNCKVWINFCSATFSPQDPRLPDSVLTALSRCGEKIVITQDKVLDALDFMQKQIKMIDPQFARKVLRQSQSSYENFSFFQKLELLKYCLLDKNYNDLHNLALLPLANGMFSTFQEKDCSLCLYLCSTKCPHYLVSNVDQQLVDIENDLELLSSLQNVADSGYTQLQPLNSKRVASLIPISHLSFPAKWIEDLWKWITHREVPLQHFSEKLIVPIFDVNSGVEVMSHLSHTAPTVYVPNTAHCNQYLLSALSKLNVKCCLQSKYPYVQHKDIPISMNCFSANGVVDAIHHGHASWCDISLNEQEAYYLRTLLNDATNKTERSDTLNNLPIFTTLTNSGEQLCSIRYVERKYFLKKAQIAPDNCPLSMCYFPPNVILFSNCDTNQNKLLKSLNVSSTTTVNLLINAIFPQLEGESVSKSCIQNLMQEVLENIHEIISGASFDRKEHFKCSIESLSFLPVGKNDLKKPKELYSRRPELLNLFKNEPVFPNSPFSTEAFIRVLETNGLKTTASPQDIVNIITEISLPRSNRPQQVDVVKFSRAKALLEYISHWEEEKCKATVVVPQSGFKTEFTLALIELSKCQSWLPVLASSPIDYPPALDWKGSEYTCHFVSFWESVVLCDKHNDLPLTCGVQLYFVEHSLPDYISKHFIPNMQHIAKCTLLHFEKVIYHQKHIPNVKQITLLIYKLLHKCLTEYDCQIQLQWMQSTEECVWISKYRKYVHPSVVAITESQSFRHKLEPFIYILPDELQEFSSLFRMLGVKESVSRVQIIGILRMIKDGDSTSLGISNEDAWQMVMSILSWLTSDKENVIDVSDCDKIYVPVEHEPDTEWPNLMECNGVMYTDNDFLKQNLQSYDPSSGDISFVNHRVSARMAHCLHLHPLSKHLHISEDAFEDVGQSEPLTVRLRNILNDYKDGLTILKELLQNADDAGASEVNVIYDARHHQIPKDSLFYPGMAECHGPALLFHNNAMFTQDDFKNITKLAGSTKEEKALKIGKFGVGFCSVYHITDIPSFVSDNLLYIFDPTLTYLREQIKNPAQPGKKVIFTSNLINRSHQLVPYKDIFGFNPQERYTGTIFRFPFRTRASELSEKIYSSGDVQQLIDDIKTCSSKLVLFLQNIRTITVCQIKDGETDPIELVKITNTTQTISQKTIHQITCTCHGSSSVEYWLMHTSSKTILQRCSIASVACSLVPLIDAPDQFRVQRIEGEVFCFLPLSIKTGLPVHISSNFAVNNNRTGIWTSDGESKMIAEVKWNETLIQETINTAYSELLLSLKHLCTNAKLKNYVFFSLWPLEKDLRVHNPWILLVQTLYNKNISSIASNDLFFSESIKQWLPLTKSKFLAIDILKDSSKDQTISDTLQKVVERLKLPVVNLPEDYHFRVGLQSLVITEKAFLNDFFSNIQKCNSIIETRNYILILLLESFANEIDQKQERYTYLKNFLSSNPCVPCNPKGELQKCEDIVHPKAKFSGLFGDEDNVFPISDFFEKKLVEIAMKALGMIHDLLPTKLLIERAQTVKTLYKNEPTKALKRAKLIVECITDQIDSFPNTTGSGIESVEFLPVMPKPDNYPLAWFGESRQLLSGKELVYKGELNQFGDTNTNICIAASQVPFLHEAEPIFGGCGSISNEAINILCLQKAPTAKAVFLHFQSLIKLHSENYSTDMKLAETIARNVYQYLENLLRSNKSMATLMPLDLSPFSHLSCIWTGNCFTLCENIADEWKLKDGPYLFKVPESIVTNPYLLKALNIKLNFTICDFLRTLQSLHKEYGKSKLPYDCQKLVREIISELFNPKLPEDHIPVMLPDSSFVLHEAHKLAFNDAQWLAQEKGYIYVNEFVNRELAKKLGVKMVRSKMLEKYRSDKRCIPFGQHETITRRIQNILRGYPFDVTILKELLQNADDARANKIYIIIDKRNHPKKSVLSDKWQELQGPALLVWNDSEFTEDDLDGIQKLGLGNKRYESEKIGQYGIGFCAVYHLTDCPSFISGGSTLCVLDPHCKYLPEATMECPGGRFDKINTRFWDDFPDMKSTYLCSGIQNCPPELQGGTLFRFPLRHSEEQVSESKIIDNESKIFEGLLSAEKMHEYLEAWAHKMKQSMLFLNHVTEISFFSIAEGTDQLQMEHCYRVNIDIPNNECRGELHDKIIKFNTTKGCKPYIAKYQISVEEYSYSTDGEPENIQTYLVQQGVGDIGSVEQVWPLIEQVKPRHGIAVPLLNMESPHCFIGQVFCFLPLPIECNLPVHVNGHFILDSNRRSLWKSTSSNEPDIKQQWNINLMRAIASSYANFIVNAKSDYVVADSVEVTDIQRYYKIFPQWIYPKCCQHVAENPKQNSNSSTTKPISNEADPKRLVKPTASFHNPNVPTNEWLEIAKNVFKRLAQLNAEILAVIEQQLDHKTDNTSKQQCSIKWFPLKDEKCPQLQVYFVKPKENKRSLNTILERLGMKFTRAHFWIQKQFKEIGQILPVLSHKTAFVHYSEFHKLIHGNQKLPCLIEDTNFQSESDFTTFAKYLLHTKTEEGSCASTKPLFGLPLLLTADKKLRYFSKESHLKVVVSKYSSLFPEHLGYFLHPSLIDVQYDQSYFLQAKTEEDEAKTEEDGAKTEEDGAKTEEDGAKTEEDGAKTEEDEAFCLEVIDTLLFSILPKSLRTPYIDSVPVNTKLLTRLWECLLKDQFFEQHLMHILKQWALLLSHHQKLYGIPSSPTILPIMPLDETDKSDGYRYICDVLQNELKVPFLDTSVVKLCTKEGRDHICPNFTQPEEILQVIYCFHCKHDLMKCMTKDIAAKLIHYFRTIHLERNEKCVEYVKSLPVFLTMHGNFTSLETKRAYIWPPNMCVDGQDIWFRDPDVVFLDGSSEWRYLRLEKELKIDEIHPVEIYTEFIFQKFDMMSDEMRYKHLKYIRDFHLDFALLHVKVRSKYFDQSSKFIQDLKQVKCIGSKAEVLRSIEELYNHEETIFRCFYEYFHFLPMWFREGENMQHRCKLSKEEEEKKKEYSLWMSFFEQQGLHCTITDDEFLHLCHQVADGRLTKNLRQKSNELRDYLFKLSNKPLSPMYMSEVAKIPFVCAESTEEVTWITPAPPPQATIQIGNESISMTTLHGACLHRDRLLAWTVKPIIKFPWLDFDLDHYKYRFKQFQVCYPLKVSDVVEHIVNISTAKFQNLCVEMPKKNKTLIEVMAKCFKFLNSKLTKSEEKYVINILATRPCIPVHANADQSTGSLLVLPQRAILSDEAVHYEPLLHKVPNELCDSTLLLKKIGVHNSIQLSHLKTVLCLLQKQLNGQEMDLNTQVTVSRTIKHIYSMCTTERCVVEKEAACKPTPLFLPAHDNKLYDSSLLLYQDTFSYRDCCLNSKGTKYFLFRLPPSDSKFQDHYTFINEFCKFLPEEIRPKPLSKHCYQSLSEKCTALPENNEIGKQLKTILGLRRFSAVCLAILKHVGERHYDPVLDSSLPEYLNSIQVITIEDLEVNIVLQENRQVIGSCKVNLFLRKDKNSAVLYLRSNLSKIMQSHIYKLMTQELVIVMQEIAQNMPASIFENITLNEPLTLLLGAETLDHRDIQDVFELCKIPMDGTDLGIPQITPRVGAEIPTELHYTLDQNNCHIFHSQELIGYELCEGYFVFAEILHTVWPDNFNPLESTLNPVQMKYRIRTSSSDEDGRIVTALDLYKFLRGPKQDFSSEISEDQQQVPNDKDCFREPVPNENNARQQLCQELKEIWQLDETERNKAVQRLYLKWHPDKNPNTPEFAEEMFKFLKEQLMRLEQGLEPQAEDITPVFELSLYWKEHFENWDKTASAHKRHHEHHREYFRRDNPNRFQRTNNESSSNAWFDDCNPPSKNPDEAKVWVQQAEIDFKALEKLLEGAQSDLQLASHVCFMAHEVAEKALKGGMYAVCGLRAEHLVVHDICLLARTLKSEKNEIALDLPSFTTPLSRYYLDTRFPNRYSPSAVPSRCYSLDDALEAHRNAKNILKIVVQLVEHN